jgi:hypothetical protein
LRGQNERFLSEALGETAVSRDAAVKMVPFFSPFLRQRDDHTLRQVWAFAPNDRRHCKLEESHERRFHDEMGMEMSAMRPKKALIKPMTLQR